MLKTPNWNRNNLSKFQIICCISSFVTVRAQEKGKATQKENCSLNLGDFSAPVSSACIPSKTDVGFESEIIQHYIDAKSLKEACCTRFLHQMHTVL